MIQTIAMGYMSDINNPKTQAEIFDILRSHFYTMANSENHVDQSYFEEEFVIWFNKNLKAEQQKGTQ
jgi:hypothetical protein